MKCHRVKLTRGAQGILLPELYLKYERPELEHEIAPRSSMGGFEPDTNFLPSWVIERI